MSVQDAASGISEPRRRIIPGVGKKRRRPSGERPPVPYSLRWTGRLLLIVSISALLLLTAVALTNLGQHIDDFDNAIVRGFAGIRTSTLTTVAKAVASLGSRWELGALRWAVILILLVFKRFRHLLIFIGSILLTGLLITELSLFFARARPIGVNIIGHWQGASMPSKPVAAAAATAIGIV